MRPPSSSRPAERADANGTISPSRELALAQQLEHQGAHLSGGAHHGDSIATAHASRLPSAATPARLHWPTVPRLCVAMKKIVTSTEQAYQRADRRRGDGTSARSPR